MSAFNCPNCGAALPAHGAKLEIAACEFCGTTFRTFKSHTPRPDLGSLLLGADFGEGNLPGWELIKDGKITFHKGEPPELRGFYKPQLNSYYVLISSGFLDDFDAGITIKFTEGDEKLITAGFYARFSNQGGYGIYISPLGSYNIGYFSKDSSSPDFKWNPMVDWTYHSSLKKGLNAVNRLRLLCDGEKIRVYLNGVLATSIKDSRYTMGKLHVIVEPNGDTNLGIAFSDLQVREIAGD